MSMHMNMKERKRREKQLVKTEKRTNMDKEVIVYYNGDNIAIGKIVDANETSIILLNEETERKIVCRNWYKVVVNGYESS